MNLCEFPITKNKQIPMKQFLTAIIILSILGCQKDPEGYSISGKIKNVENGKMVYLSELDNNNQPVKIDSAVIKDEKFNMSLPAITQSNLSFLNIEGLNGNVIFISENEQVDFEIYKDSLPTSQVSGGKENKVFYSYLDHLKNLNQRVMKIRTELRKVITTNKDSSSIAKLQKEEADLRSSDMTFKKKIVEENPDTFVSVLILTDMINMGATTSEVNELYETLTDGLKQTPLAKTLKENMDKRSTVEVGSKAPEFSAPNPQGEVISLKDSMGKITLIDFWAAWCKPCRVENPNLVRIYNKYHEQGFNIIGVSLDKEGQKDKWLKAIEDDKLTWSHVSNLQFWQEPIAQLYGVRSIPAAFILDENGVIVSTNLRGDALEAKVKELLEK
jgi:peroxiredoxin